MPKARRVLSKILYLPLVALLTTSFGIGYGTATDSSDAADLQTIADVHTSDACILHDRSQITAPHSPVKVVGIASLGFRQWKEPSARGSHDNHCDYVLRPPDENSKLKTTFKIMKKGKARGLKGKKFRFAAKVQDSGKSRRGSNRRFASRFSSSEDVGTDAQLVKGTGLVLSFQNDDRMMRRKRDVAQLRSSDATSSSSLNVTEKSALYSKAIDERNLTHRLVRRSIQVQSNKDVFFDLMMEKDEKTDCFYCDGRCLNQDVKCNFVDDCNMKDEIGCLNPKNLTILEPMPVVEVAEPTTDGQNFETYVSKCVPTNKESCLELAACLEDPRCGPKTGEKFDRAVILIKQWRENFPETTNGEEREQSTSGIAWWIPFLICLILILLIIVVIVIVLIKKRKKRRMMGDDGDPDESTTVHGNDTDFEENVNQFDQGDGLVFVSGYRTGSESTYDSSSESVPNKLQTEFDKADREGRGVLNSDTAKMVVGSAIGCPVPLSLWRELTENNINKDKLTLLDLSLFIMEHHENGIRPDKVGDLFSRDYPPGLDEAIIAQVMNNFCREKKYCEVNELEDLLAHLHDRQRQQLPGTAVAFAPAEDAQTIISESIDGSAKRSVAETNLADALKKAKYDDKHSRDELAAAVAAYTAAQSKSKTKKASAAAAAQAPLFTAARALLHNFEETDVRIEEEMARVEDAIESEDKAKLSALLKPGALPSMEIYMADKHKEKVEEIKITHEISTSKEAIKSIKPGDMAEIKSYKSPDPMIFHTIQGVMLMTGYLNSQVKDWPTIQKELADTSHNKLINRIMGMNMKSLDSDKVNQAAKLVNGITFEEVKKKSRTASIFFTWMNSVFLRFKLT